MDAPLDLLVIVAVVLLLAGVGTGLVRRRRVRRAPADSPRTDVAGPAGDARPAGDAGRPDAASAEDDAGPTSTRDAVATDISGADDASTVPGVAISPAERFRDRLARTRNVLATSVADLFGRGVTDEAWEGLEEALIAADVGVAAATEIVEEVRRRSRAEGATTREAVESLLAEQLRAILDTGDRSLGRRPDGLTVWLVTGVNGTGKTTTIGKLAAAERRAGTRVVLAAADTFRAAAAEQLGVWAERTGATLVRKDEGADPASVAFEGVDAAERDGADLLVVDTAGRLHNKRELMDELGKVRRVLERRADGIDEVLLVLDATTGQNGIAQARAFLDAVEVTGVALTKLDGSSKGGIVVAVQSELSLPVKLVGLGEDVDDLAAFDPDLFVQGLLGD
jgi:fused signal recognition particle receptor